ncbi:MAG: restriction endonuclease subunit S, partial [Microbacteriaceae bacterium]
SKPSPTTSSKPPPALSSSAPKQPPLSAKKHRHRAPTLTIWVIRPTQSVPISWLTAVASTQEFTDFAMSGSEGTKMPRAKWEHVGRYEVPVPDGLPVLNETFDTLWEQIWALADENRTLRRTRDELLPLLMSGKVRVKPEGAAA